MECKFMFSKNNKTLSFEYIFYLELCSKTGMKYSRLSLSPSQSMVSSSASETFK